MSSSIVSRVRIAFLLGIALALLLPAVGASAAPPSPKLLKRAAHNPALAARLIAREARARARGIDRPQGRRTGVRSVLSLQPQRAAGTTGTLKTLALLVDFSDQPSAVASSFFDSLLFADTYGPTSVRGYYRETSYGSTSAHGLLDVVTVNLPSSVGWKRLPQTMAYYVAGGDNGTGTYPNNAQKMVEDAIAAADPYVDFSQYDNDGDGWVDNLFVIHAGQGAEYSGSSSHIWSHQWWTKYTPYVDGVSVGSYSTEPEFWSSPGDMTIGVYCHEMGHVLGLPDLYDRDYSSSGIGEWSLMAGGSWNGATGMGESPARFDAWSASQLDWLQPHLITGAPATKSIPAVSSSTTAAYKLYPDGASTGSEYFLVENRRQTGTDTWLPGAGLLVWHVDETRNTYELQNDDETHKLVDLEEAAGWQSLDSGSDSGGADDPYPGTSINRAFNDTSTPDAKTYGGAASKVVVDQIGDSATTMSARLGAGTSTVTDTTPPATTVTGNDSLWHRSTVTLTFSASDSGAGASGVAYTQYRVDGGAWQTGTSCAVTAGASIQHTYTVGYRSADNRGNVESEKTWQVKIDTIAPTVAITGASPNGSYKVDKHLTVTATDAAGGSGPAKITYRIDVGAPVIVLGATADVLIRALPNAAHVVTYSATDGAGNTCASATFRITMDTAGPVGQGRNVSGRKGRRIPLRYRFNDNLSSLVWNIKVTVKNRSGRVVKRFSLGLLTHRTAGVAYTVKWRPKVRGRYRYSVTCQDSAGNRQARKAVGTVTVR